MEYKIITNHPELAPYEDDIDLRMKRYWGKRSQILQGQRSLKEFANAHQFFGFHKIKGGWVYREWAPAADRLYLTGDFNNWH